MNQASMYEMRHSIVRAVSDYVEIEGEEMVEVNISSDMEIGTVYSVAVPVRCSPTSPWACNGRPSSCFCVVRQP